MNEGERDTAHRGGQPVEGNDLYRSLRGTLTRYISSITTDSILGRWMTKHGVTSMSLTVAEAEQLIDESSHALRLFVEADDLPELFLEVAELLTREG